MSDTSKTLREALKDPEYSEGYAESFLDSYIATQIKVLREQHGLSQQGLAELIGSKQGAISRIENVNYSRWNVSTLKKLARVFRLRLKVSFETYGTLLSEVEMFTRNSLQRTPRENDLLLNCPPSSVRRVFSNPTPYIQRVHIVPRTRARIFIHHRKLPTPARTSQGIVFDMPNIGRILDSQTKPEQKPPINSIQELVMGANG